ncbi:MAG: tight adherence protein [Clostridia bacterium]|nr:tight adherence protein [Clostridia bacterium]
MHIFLSVLSGLSAIVMFGAIYLILTEERQIIYKRIQNYTQSPEKKIEIEGKKQKRKLTLKNILGFIGKIFATRSFTKKIEEELSKADIPLRGEEFIVINLLTLLFSGTIGYLINGKGASLVMAVVGGIGPFLYIKRKKKLRIEYINSQLGDCLTVMTNSLRAGYSLQQTMDLVSREMTGPLAMEFYKTLREINFGTPIEKALENLARRVESKDIDLMITAVLIQRQIGGNLAEILDNISHTLRERIRITGEIKTLTAQGRISGLIIGLIAPVIFSILLIINPDYINVLLEKQIGLYILFGGIISELVGVVLIKKIVNIEV